MKCDDARLRLSLMLDGELPVPQEADLLRHLEECAACTEYHAKLKAADQRLAAAAQTMAPPLDDVHARQVAARALAAGRKGSLLWRSVGIFASMAALVLVSISAIAIYVNTARPQPQELLLFGGPIVEDGRAQQRLHVRDGTTGRPVAGAQVTAFLKTDLMQTALKLLDIQTDANGDAVIDVEAPAGVTSCSLDIRVQSPVGSDRIERRLSIVRPRRIYVSTDKPLYQPGQIVHVAVKAVNSFSMRPVAGEEIGVLITDPSGNKVYRNAKKTSDFGIIGVDFTLADELILGRYVLKATLGGVETERAFEVKRYVLPKFEIDLALNRNYCRPGEPITGTVAARYFTSKPVRGSVVVAGSVWEIDKFVEKFRVTGELSDDGRFTFMATVPNDAFGTLLDRGDAALRVEATVTDTAEHPESKALMATVSMEPLKVVLVPDGGLVEGIENRLWVAVTKPDGTPVRAQLMFPHRGFETDDSGIALVPIPNLRHELLIDVRAADGAFTKVTWDPRNMGRDERQFAMRFADSVIRGGKPLEMEIDCAFDAGTIYLDIVREGHTILTKALEVRGRRASFAADLPPDAIGTVQVRAYRVLPGGEIERDTRLILVEPPQGLKFKVTPAKAEFRPGEEMPVVIEVTDAQGKPVETAMTLSVVDAAVFALHESRPGLERVYLAIQEELLKPRYQLKGTVDVSTVFEHPERGCLPLASVQPGGTPLLEEVRLRAKAEFFETRARKFNRWLQDVLAGALVLAVLAGFVAFIGYSIQFVKSRHGVGPAIGCGAMWAGGLFVLLIVTGTMVGMKSAEMERMVGAAPTGMAPRGPDTAPIPVRHGDPGAGPRIRQYFPETLYWTPELITGPDGRASLTLPAADSITTWKLGASGITRTGRMGATTADVRVFQEFFVDVDLPVALTQGDLIHIPVTVSNYMAEEQTVRLEFDAPGFELRDEAKKELTLQPNDVKSVYFKARASSFGLHAITVKAYGKVEDAVRRTVEVVPDGKEMPISVSDRVLGRRTFTVHVPPAGIDHASKAWVRLYPSTFSEIVTGLERLVRLPHG